MVYKIPISVLVILFTRQHDVLLLERADRPGFWQSVTGSKEDENESLATTAQREVKEETGLNFDRNQFLDWNRSFDFEIFRHWRGRYKPGTTHNTEHVFSLLVENKLKIEISPREHLSYCWIDLNSAIAKVFSWTNVIALKELPSYHMLV